jgi:hypothetical protein
MQKIKIVVLRCHVLADTTFTATCTIVLRDAIADRKNHPAFPEFAGRDWLASDCFLSQPVRPPTLNRKTMSGTSSACRHQLR